MDFFKLESLCDEIIDCPHSTPRWLDSGIRVIRNYNLNGAHFDFSKSSYVDEETYLNRTKRAKPEANDIIISREAPMGDSCNHAKRFKMLLRSKTSFAKS